MNDGKTDIIDVASSYNAVSIRTPGLHIADSSITLSGSMQDLEVISDKLSRYE